MLLQKQNRNIRKQQTNISYKQWYKIVLLIQSSYYENIGVLAQFHISWRVYPYFQFLAICIDVLSLCLGITSGGTQETIRSKDKHLNHYTIFVVPQLRVPIIYTLFVMKRNKLNSLILKYAGFYSSYSNQLLNSSTIISFQLLFTLTIEFGSFILFTY